MRIKRTSDNNEYINADGVWVRNFTKPIVPYSSINSYATTVDFPLLTENEIANSLYQNGDISDERIVFPKVAIVSDGYNFSLRRKAIDNLPDDVAIFAVNRTLSKWIKKDPRTISTPWKKINIYIANNPYPQCRQYLPLKTSNYYPTCVLSKRTNPVFVKEYRGRAFFYQPTPEKGFGLNMLSKYYIDDYRNPICAAIGLAYRFRASKIMLISCDDSFTEQKDFAERLPNGLWTYPQQILSQRIMDANLYWFTHQESNETRAANYSDGIEFKNAEYINNDEAMINFFKEEEGDTTSET